MLGKNKGELNNCLPCSHRSLRSTVSSGLFLQFYKASFGNLFALWNYCSGLPLRNSEWCLHSARRAKALDVMISSSWFSFLNMKVTQTSRDDTKTTSWSSADLLSLLCDLKKCVKHLHALSSCMTNSSKKEYARSRYWTFKVWDEDGSDGWRKNKFITKQTLLLVWFVWITTLQTLHQSVARKT